FVRLPTARLELGESVRRSPLTAPLPKGLGPARLSAAQLERNEPAQPSGLKPDHLMLLSPETHRAVMAWQAAQEKPGGTPEAKAPDDAALAKAMELLRAKLK